MEPLANWLVVPATEAAFPVVSRLRENTQAARLWRNTMRIVTLSLVCAMLVTAARATTVMTAPPGSGANMTITALIRAMAVTMPGGIIAKTPGAASAASRAGTGSTGVRMGVITAAVRMARPDWSSARLRAGFSATRLHPAIQKFWERSLVQQPARCSDRPSIAARLVAVRLIPDSINLNLVSQFLRGSTENDHG